MDLFDEIYTNIDSGNLSSTAFTGTSGGKFVLQTSPTINTSLTLAGATFTQSNASSGTAVSYSLSNTSNTASSDAKQIISVGGSSAGDAFTNWNVSGTTDWVAGIDNSTGNDEWRLQKAAALTSDYLIGCSQGGSGASNTVAILNSFDVADSQSLLQISVGGTSAGDAITTYSIGSTTYWTTGIDNSDNDYWKLQKAATLSSDYLLLASQGGSGANNLLNIQHSSNTSGSNAYLQISVGGTSSGDAYTYYAISGGSSWHTGIDNSDSDKLKVGTGSTIGTNTYFQIDTSGNSTVNGTLTVSGTTSTQLTITNLTATTTSISNCLLGYMGDSLGGTSISGRSGWFGLSTWVGANPATFSSEFRISSMRAGTERTTFYTKYSGSEPVISTDGLNYWGLGPYVAGAAAATGYIEVYDDSGTTYKLLTRL